MSEKYIAPDLMEVYAHEVGAELASVAVTGKRIPRFVRVLIERASADEQVLTELATECAFHLYSEQDMNRVRALGKAAIELARAKAGA